MNMCILIRAKPGKVKEVLERIKRMKEVSEAISTFGRYDLVVFALPSDYESAREISRKISQIKGIKSTETLLESI